MNQISLATTGFKLVTKRMLIRQFLDEMSLVIPWPQLLALITPAEISNKTGSLPFATKVMLRIFLLQQLFTHSDINASTCELAGLVQTICTLVE